MVKPNIRFTGQRQLIRKTHKTIFPHSDTKDNHELIIHKIGWSQCKNVNVIIK